MSFRPSEIIGVFLFLFPFFGGGRGPIIRQEVIYGWFGAIKYHGVFSLCLDNSWAGKGNEGSDLLGGFGVISSQLEGSNHRYISRGI